MNNYLSDPLSLFSVKDKVVVITGASGAFGSMAAELMAAAGARLILAAGNKLELEMVLTKCKSYEVELDSVRLRPSSEENCEAIIQAAIDNFGRVDVLIVGSGKNDKAKIDEMSTERFLDVMDANVTQSWLIAKSASKQMQKQGDGGRIIFMSSIRGLLGAAHGYSAYCASKAAIDGMTRALGCELGASGITVNAIAPMVFRSKLTAWMFEDTELANEVRNGTVMRMPKGRLSEPDDLAGPLLFLASQASDFYTGHVLYVDGGYTAG
jgi:NAD(P)-dependent dehydrogenase (short-subunit alcohol dehydrogenase family)